MLHYIDRFLRDLEPQLASARLALDDWAIRTADYQASGVYQFRDQEERSLKVGQVWGDAGTTAFLRRTVAIPAEFSGQKVGLALITGGEGLVRINGVPYHGLDSNRWFVPLVEEATGNERYDVEIEVYNPIPVPPDVLNNPHSPEWQPKVLSLSRAELVAVNRPLVDLWFTMKVYRDTAAMLPAADPSRTLLVRALNEMVLRLEGRDLSGLESLQSDLQGSDSPWGPSRFAQRSNSQGGASRFAQRSDSQAAHSALIGDALAHLKAQAKQAEGGTLPGRLIMIGQSHIDVAWLWPIKETVRKCSRTFSTTFTLMDEYPHYLFTQSQPQLLAYTKQHYPELYAKIKQKVAEGRWELVGGMWIEPDLNLPSGESLVRQLLFGLRFWQQEFGQRPRIEWLPDTFGYCAALPQILKKAGMEYFMTVKMYWNDTNPFPYDIFWWEGIDGTRVLSFLNHGLNEPATPQDIRDHWNHFKQKDRHPEEMYLYGWGDGGGGVTREMLEYIAREEKLPGLPRISTGTAHEFFDRLAASDADLPMWRGDLYLELHRGTYTTQARNKRHNRKAELLYREAELWSVVAGPHGWQYPAQALHGGWEKILLNQFHDILPGSSIPAVYADSEVDYAEIHKFGNEVRSGALQHLVGAIDTQGGGREGAGREGASFPGARLEGARREGTGRPVVVFNSLGWTRTDVVRVAGGPELQGLAVVDEADRQLPSQLVRVASAIWAGQADEREGAAGAGRGDETRQAGGDRWELWFLAPDVPSLGYRTFWLVERAPEIERAPGTAEDVAGGKVSQTGFQLDEGPRTGVSAAGGPLQDAPDTWETEALILSFNENGQITRLYDKTNGREVIPEGAVANQLQLFVDRPPHWDAWDVDPRYPERPFEEAQLTGWELRSRGPVCNVLRFRWEIGVSQVEQDVVLYHHTPRIDFETWVDWREDHQLLKVAFPVDVLSSTASFEIPFGSVQRATHNNTSWERAQYEVCGHKWADLSQADYGVSLLNDCKYGYDVKGQVLRLSLLRAPKWPDPNADRGQHRFTYSLYPHAGDWRQGGTVRQAFGLNVPLVAVQTEPHAGKLPSTDGFAVVESDHLVLDTVKLAEEGDGIILRFYEAHGVRGHAKVRLSRPVASVTVCNLLEEPDAAADPEGGVAVEGDGFEFAVKPYEILTFKVALA